MTRTDLEAIKAALASAIAAINPHVWKSVKAQNEAALAIVQHALDEPAVDGWQAGAEAMREECIRYIDGGSFLHDQAPPRLFANQVIAGLRRIPIPPGGRT